jgi:hypothetical protein
MVWYRKEPPDQEQLRDWLLRHGRRWRSDGLARAARTLQALAIHAGENGSYSASVRLLARATSRRRASSELARDHDAETFETRDPEAATKAFQRGIKDLLEVGAISANKPLTVRQGRYLKRGLHWDEDGVVITLHEELRAQAERRSIRELLTG